ncbi:MAG: hypothetical protein RBT33_04005 [Candidatus Dojkabacteria bacterium]|jgi:hypothetical protein|nr:hypothetical protein [Candidatus Dojkabacteria bacterium]
MTKEKEFEYLFSYLQHLESLYYNNCLEFETHYVVKGLQVRIEALRKKLGVDGTIKDYDASSIHRFDLLSNFKEKGE